MTHDRDPADAPAPEGDRRPTPERADGPASLGRRALVSARQQVRRHLQNPFGPGRSRPVLVHGSHHKAGTVWVQRILKMVATHHGLRFAESPSTVHEPAAPAPRPDAEIVLLDRANDIASCAFTRPVRVSHMIRDPRDIVVSGYYYHLRTDEPWVRRPDARWNGASYQQHLRGLDRHDGLMAEIELAATTTLADLAAWPALVPDAHDIRYEDAVAAEQATFEALFRFYGFTDAAVARSLDIVRHYRERRDGVVGAEDTHVRSGRPGEWRDQLDAAHLHRLRSLTGDLVTRLGYEEGEPAGRS